MGRPIFLGTGGVTGSIGEYGSVSAAAKSMQMSFSHAWHLVENMNGLPLSRWWKNRLVDDGEERLAHRCRAAGHHRFLENGARFQQWMDQEELAEYPLFVADSPAKPES